MPLDHIEALLESLVNVDRAVKAGPYLEHTLGLGQE